MQSIICTFTSVQHSKYRELPKITSELKSLRSQNNLERAEHYVRPFTQIMNNSFLFNSSSYVHYGLGRKHALFPSVQLGPHHITMHCYIYSSVCLLVHYQTYDIQLQYPLIACLWFTLVRSLVFCIAYD